ncbi:S-layer homology domain-containing protein [Paenibacillus typhae]|uniref:S-layer homology domain-containing protein n=1 Tax=Paenibacillus typhae TaxID=1174501 RepID=UPI001C8D79F3|nr:S-layer homology domain-containing protein [Paenibacillus typhae]MBY0013676.1 S-layer homology domain-containing protein [Paenibacillus typhae]
MNIRNNKWLSGFLALLLAVMSLGLPAGFSSTALAGAGGMAVYTDYALPASDSAQLRAEVLQYDTANPIIQKGFELWPAAAGTIPPANPQTINTGAGMESQFLGYATGLMESSGYYFRAFIQTQDTVISYGEPILFTTVSAAAMNGEQWITSYVPFAELEYENGTPAEDVQWPSEIDTILSDGTHKKFPVAWDNQSYYEYMAEDGGKFSFQGAIQLPDGSKVVLHPNLMGQMFISQSIKVLGSNIAEIAPLPSLTVPVGTTLQQILQKLPSRAEVTLKNGKQETAYPQWDSGAPAFVPDTAGTYVFTGLIGPGDPPLRNDDNLSASVTVNVVPYLWQLVGRAGFTGDEADFVTFAFDQSGNPYAAFKDKANGGKASVMIFNGTNWYYIGGEGHTAGTADSLSLAYDSSSDTLYLAYADGTAGNAITVEALDLQTTAWSTVGTAGFTPGAASSISLAVDSWGSKPYVAFADEAHGGKVSAMTFNGTSWELLGTAGFSAEAVQQVNLTVNYGSLLLTAEAGSAPHAVSTWEWGYYNPAWSLQSGGIPASEYSVQGDGNGQKALVYQNEQGVHYSSYYYGSWNSGSAQPVTDAQVQALDLTMMQAGKYSYAPYVAYAGTMDSGKVTVKTLDTNTGSWVTVGPPAFTAGAAQELKLRVYEGTPYVAIKDGAQNGKLTVLKYGPAASLSVETLPAVQITETSASVSASVQNAAGTGITERGIVYSASAAPAVGSGTAEASSGTADEYELKLTGLKPATVYYARGYIVTLNGIVYGNEITFTTLESGTVNPPVDPAEPGEPGEPAEPTAPPTEPAEPTPTPAPDPGPVSTPAPSSQTGSGVVTAGASPVLTVTVKDPNDQTAKPANTKITQLVGDKLDMTATLFTADGKPLNIPAVTVKAGTGFQLPNVPAGTYKMLLNVIAPTGEKLAGTLAKLTVSADGSASIESELIDPYGIITDSVSGKTVDDVKVTLHWMDTALNKSKGRMADALVELPELPDFAPNQNKDPQYSKDGGQYGWMVYPEGDYYILAEKAGYETFDSRKESHEATFGDDSYIRNGTIHVGQSIVEYSFEIDPKLKESGKHTPYMVGYPNGLFLPQNGITRAELAAILSRTMTAGSSAPVQAAFKDVPAAHWSASAIRTAAANGWMKGYAGGTFKPEGKVTRAELAAVLARVKQAPLAESAAAAFGDVQGHWAEASIKAVAASGLFNGYEDGSFKPDQAVTRAETVHIFNQLLERHTENLNLTQVWPDVPEELWSFVDIMEASLTHSYNLYETGSEVWTGQ